MRETWGLLDSGHCDAATNMAIDEALLTWHSEGKIPPTIRFYGWEKPSLSVGQFQKSDKTIDFSGVEKYHCDFVRRLTGGSAVLHDDELTYSIIVSENHPKIPTTVNKAYYILSQGLLEGYRMLGIDASLAEPKQSRSSRSAVCFETSAIYEMMVDGKKISGNAQTRMKGVLLQHGSIPLSFNAEMLFDLFYFSNDNIRNKQRLKFIDKAISINDIMNTKQTYETILPAFLKGFQNSLHIKTEEMTLDKAQWDFIKYLRETKYASDAWNQSNKRKMGSV